MPNTSAVIDLICLIFVLLVLYSDNRLEMPTDVTELCDSFSNVKVLKLNRVHYSWQQV